MNNNQLTLEQAIQHAGERAAELSGPCAAQHAQLAAWLRELQQRRQADKNCFMYGIADPDGKPYLDEFCVSSDLGLMEDEVSALNDTFDTDDYRVVALYTALPLTDSERTELEERRKVDLRKEVRADHAAWADKIFGSIGPVGPLKHLSKEALEAAASPGDLSEWADMQFLLWDAQRRAGISDEQITHAMVEKLAVNKQREWPEPKDGEPRLHIKEKSELMLPEIECDICGHVSTDPEGRHYCCEDNGND